MILWSIMICTLCEREVLYKALMRKLRKQILKSGKENEIEVLRYCDNRELLVGEKRNKLMEAASGKYVSFIDDDDDISDSYIDLLYRGIQHDRDCVALEGIITINGGQPKRFIHSIKHKSYFLKSGIYYRPPNHLNAIKKSLVQSFKFPEKNFSEDYDWSMAVCRAGVLQSEAPIDKPVYFYKSQRRK